MNVSQVQQELQSSCLKRLVFSLGMRAKEAEIKKGVIRNNSMWDKLAFGKIKESTGGRLRLMVVGSAPLAGNVLTFARCALGCLVVEGYGQTECCAPVTLTIQVGICEMVSGLMGNVREMIQVCINCPIRYLFMFVVDRSNLHLIQSIVFET